MSFKPLKRNGLFADQVGPVYNGSRVCQTARWGAELKHRIRHSREGGNDLVVEYALRDLSR
jgi:hypothetical protein